PGLALYAELSLDLDAHDGSPLLAARALAAWALAARGRTGLLLACRGWPAGAGRQWLVWIGR
ncbi:MAG: hypothetical protein ACKOZX_03790, partial [Gammaproteobacteria bacterium]